MDVKDQIEQIKEFIVTFSIDSNTDDGLAVQIESSINQAHTCLLYTSPSPRDGLLSRMPSSA